MPPYGQSVRIGFCIAGHAAVGAIPVVEILRSINSQGHEAVLVALSQNGTIPSELFTQATAKQFENRDWWQTQDFDVVFAYSFSFSLSILATIQESGTSVILDCDSDGRVSARLWPRDSLRHYEDERHSLSTKLRIYKHWAKRCIWSYAHETSTAALLKQCDLIRIESNPAQKNLQRFMAYRRINRAQQDIRVIPFCAPIEVFSETPCQERLPKMVVAGRLASQQKNPQVLADATRKLLRLLPSLEVSIFSRGEAEEFRSLTQAFESRVTYRQDCPKEDVSRALRESRILFSASRFETLPVVGIEALCMGCTLVATPLDGYAELIERNRFGTISNAFSVKSLVKSFIDEWEQWEIGARCPIQIASAARSRFHPDVVAGQLIDAAESCESLQKVPQAAATNLNV